MTKKRTIRFELRLTEQEALSLVEKSKAFKNNSEFIRNRIFKEGGLTNTVEFMNQFNEISTEIKKIGNNLNQFSKYVNYLAKNDIQNDEIITQFNETWSSYNEMLQELVNLYRKIIIL